MQVDLVQNVNSRWSMFSVGNILTLSQSSHRLGSVNKGYFASAFRGAPRYYTRWFRGKWFWPSWTRQIPRFTADIRLCQSWRRLSLDELLTPGWHRVLRSSRHAVLLHRAVAVLEPGRLAQGLLPLPRVLSTTARVIKEGILDLPDNVIKMLKGLARKYRVFQNCTPGGRQKYRTFYYNLIVLPET